MKSFEVSDPILTEVIGQSFISIAKEMSVTIQRTAYSSVVREASDFSTGVFDADGNLIAQAENNPSHLGQMDVSLKTLLNNYFPKNTINEGDQLIVNNPYSGASHLNDIFLVVPVFVGKQLIGFCASMCHHVDMGGSAPGSFPPDSTEIFQEGLSIPPLRLFEKGVLNETIISILRSNVRMPDYTLGDLRSQISANEIGKRRMNELFNKYGIMKTKSVIEDLYNYSEARVRSKLLEIPNGIYEATGFLDDDGVDIGKRIPLMVKIEIKEDKIIYDLTKSSSQVRGPYNETENMVRAVVAYVTRAVTDPEVPQNEGVFRVLELKTKKGTIFNPTFPAPVNGRHHTNLRLTAVCLEALAKAMPNQLSASGNAQATTIAINGYDPRNNFRFVYVEINDGGLGARPTKDGISGIGSDFQNGTNVPIEAAELEYPLLFKRYELYPDSGGAGKYRGGLGMIREVETLVDNLTLTIISDGETTYPKGSVGGKNGLPGKKVLNPGTDKEKRIPGKAASIQLNKGDVVSMYTPGSGGYGNPLERDKAKVLEDLENGYFTTDTVKEIFNIDLEKEKI